RLRRGLEKLREQMDRESEGGRRAWMLALAPIAERAGRIEAATSPAARTSVGAAKSAGTVGTFGGVGMIVKIALSVAAAASVAWVVVLERSSKEEKIAAAAGSELVDGRTALEGETKSEPVLSGASDVDSARLPVPRTSRGPPPRRAHRRTARS